jgi:hypothetical protein
MRYLKPMYFASFPPFSIHRLTGGHHNPANGNSILDNRFITKRRTCRVYPEELRKVRKVVLICSEVNDRIYSLEGAPPVLCRTDIPNKKLNPIGKDHLRSGLMNWRRQGIQHPNPIHAVTQCPHGVHPNKTRSSCDKHFHPKTSVKTSVPSDRKAIHA